MAQKVTLQDIADELGLSRATVSKAFNNSKQVSEETRNEIFQKAMEMGYKEFSYFANSQQETELTTIQKKITPATNKSNIDLFLGNHITSSHFFSNVQEDIMSQLNSLGYQLNIHYVSRQNFAEQTLPNTYIQKLSAGIICIEMFDSQYNDMLCAVGLPTLFIDAAADCFQTSTKADYLLMDNRSSISLLMSEMARRGKKRFGFIGEYCHCLSFYERYFAFRETLIRLNLPFYQEFCFLENYKNGTYPFSENYQQYLLDAFRTQEQLPDVFFCANDFVAVDVLQVFQKLKITVPNDVWLCGFDDAPESRIVTPSLSTVHICKEIIGSTAVWLLLSRIQNQNLQRRVVYTETSLQLRESTDDNIGL